MNKLLIFFSFILLLLINSCSTNKNTVVVERKGIFTYALNSKNNDAPRYVKAKKGDSLWLIGQRYGVSITELAEHNNIKPPYEIAINQKIQIPSIDNSQKYTPQPNYEEPKTTNIVKDTPKKPATKPTITTVKGDFKYKHPLNNSKFIWPVDGKILKRYTKSKKPEPHEGISISAKQGTPIKATNDGEIVYVGDDLKKYGNLIIIKHRSNFMSAYAHTEKVKVKLGQRVSRGQHIANVGKTGKANSPRLFFSLQRNEKVIDPEAQLR